MKKLFLEFRDFAMKGNVMDMAVGIIIGTAFSGIVNSLVKDIITPIISVIIGRINVAELKAVIPGLFGSASISISYGLFLQAAINFLVIAFTIFSVVKVLSKLHKKQEKIEQAAPAITKSEELLAEIRDILHDKEKSAH